MRRALYSLVLCALLISSGAFAKVGLLQFASSNGVPTLYFANGGSDSNPCSSILPCQTISHLNGLTLAAGTTVLFDGGETFSGGIALTTANAPSGGVTIGSYGTGQATISSGNSTACVTATNLPSITVNNIICTGGTDTVSTTPGIAIINSQAGNTTLAGPAITNNTVSGYGGDGIQVQGANGTSGFSGIKITGNTVHDVAGEVTANPTACINIYDTGFNEYAHVNVTITGNTVYNCLGVAAGDVYNGSGIVVSGVNTANVNNNIVHDFGADDANSSGPVGVLSNLSTGILFAFNEVYNGKSNSVNDGDGIDCDQGSTNCTIQYNYTHANVGNGLMCDAVSGGPNSNCIIRWNVSQDDASRGSATYGGINIFVGSGGSETGCEIYNNTVYTNSGNAFTAPTTGATSVVCQISNNIFYGQDTSLNVIYVAGSPTLTFTGNDYFDGFSSSLTISWNGTSYSSYSAWQTATGQEKIGGSNVGLNVEPRLVTYGGGSTLGGYVPASLPQYEPQSGSPMLAAGINLTSQYSINPGSQDFYGNSIAAASLPIGAANNAIAWTSGTGTCSQSTTWLGRATGMDTAHQERDNALICGFVADGIWSTFDAFYKLAQDTAAHADLNLVSTSWALTPNNSPTFTANQGYAGNGTTTYLSTTFTPSTAGGNLTQNSAELGDYALTSNTTIQNTWIELGTQDNTASFLILYAATLGNFGSGNIANGATNENGNTTAVTLSNTNSQGLYVVTRTGSAAESLYKNISSFSTFNNASIGLPNTAMDILALGGTVVTNWTGEQLGYAFWGGGWTATQIAASSFRINADAIALGINTF